MDNKEKRMDEKQQYSEPALKFEDVVRMVERGDFDSEVGIIDLD